MTSPFNGRLSREDKPDKQKQHDQQTDAQASDAGDAAEAAGGIQKLAHGVASSGPTKRETRV